MAAQSNHLILQMRIMRAKQQNNVGSAIVLVTVTRLKSKSPMMAASKMAPRDPHPLVFMPLCDSLLECELDLVTCSWWIECGKSDAVSLQWFGYKGLWLPPSFYSLPGSSCSLTLMKPVVMLWTALWRGLHGKEMRAASGQGPCRSWGPQSTAHQELNPTHNCEWI